MKTILVQIFFDNTSSEIKNKADMEEFENLIRTLNWTVHSRVTQKRGSPDPHYFMGKGKALDIAKDIEENKIPAVVVNHALTPAQAKNLEVLFKAKVFDREALILEIFSTHARSKEAKIQVEIAKLRYEMPRLKRAWVHLERQEGGIGVMGGAGEKQIELDRRMIAFKIRRLVRDLKKIETERDTQLKTRENFFKVTLAGYTNAGKSALINSLCQANQSSKNKLFETLDSHTRQLKTVENLPILISDTVGFIKDLPHKLIASFKSTLRVVKDADLILLVIDVSSSNYNEHLDTCFDVLKELDVTQNPIWIIFNKRDLLPPELVLSAKITRKLNKPAQLVSAFNESDVESLKKKIIDEYRTKFSDLKMVVNFDEMEKLEQIKSMGKIISQEYTDEGITVWIRMDNKPNIFIE